MKIFVTCKVTVLWVNTELYYRIVTADRCHFLI